LVQHLREPVLHKQWGLVVSLLVAGPAIPREVAATLLLEASSAGEWEVVFYVLFRDTTFPDKSVLLRIAEYAREQDEKSMLRILYACGATLEPEDGNPMALHGSLRGFPTVRMRNTMQSAGSNTTF
jgi:hypothetical protein